MADITVSEEYNGIKIVLDESILSTFSHIHNGYSHGSGLSITIDQDKAMELLRELMYVLVQCDECKTNADFVPGKSVYLCDDCRPTGCCNSCGDSDQTLYCTGCANGNM